MIKSKSEMESRPIELDLTGPDGNVFVLMGYASRFAKQMSLNSKEIIEDMQSGDYEHLLSVFEKHFGKFVTLYR